MAIYPVRFPGGFVQIRDSAAKEAGMKLRSRLVAQLISVVISVLFIGTHSAFGVENSGDDDDNTVALTAFAVAGLVGAGMAALAGSSKSSSGNKLPVPHDDPSDPESPTLTASTYLLRFTEPTAGGSPLEVILSNDNNVSLKSILKEKELPDGVTIVNEAACSNIVAHGNCVLQFIADEAAHGSGEVIVEYGTEGKTITIGLEVSNVELSVEPTTSNAVIIEDGSIVLTYDEVAKGDQDFEFRIKNNGKFNWIPLEGKNAVYFHTDFNPKKTVIRLRLVVIA